MLLETMAYKFLHLQLKENLLLPSRLHSIGIYSSIKVYKRNKPVVDLTVIPSKHFLISCRTSENETLLIPYLD
jgi:hypothetical protein